jgi:hypothetical protein
MGWMMMGNPIEEYCRPQYYRGSEEAAGDHPWVSLYDATTTALARCCQVLDIGNNCESPIEAQLGAAVLVVFEKAGHPLKLARVVDPTKPMDEFLLVPQFGWHFYRSDWAIVNPGRSSALLIECDGKDFHSSPAQKRHDIKKDTAARGRGFSTIRFTGSEIYKDADGCAQKIYDAVYGA